jgi:hypothetical protein
LHLSGLANCHEPCWPNATASPWLEYGARPVNVVRTDGTLAERLEFGSSPPIRAHNREYVGFVQDRWILRPTLALDLRVRYEDERVADARLMASRAGFAWAPSADATVIRGGAGLFYGAVPLNIRSFGGYPSRTITRFASDGVTAVQVVSFTPVLESVDTTLPPSTADPDDQSAFAPESLTWNVQVDRTVHTWLVVRANVMSSHSRNLSTSSGLSVRLKERVSWCSALPGVRRIARSRSPDGSAPRPTPSPSRTPAPAPGAT